MKGIIGAHMRYKGFIVPRREYFSRLKRANITAKAKVRLSWMDYYQKTKNARLTCRHFGISPDTFYRWKRRYRSYCLKTLEDDPKSRRPQRLRTPTTDLKTVARIRYYREAYPRWGKAKIAILLKKEGHQVSESTVGRTIKRLKDRGVLKEPIPNFISAKKCYLKRAWGVRKPKDYVVKEPGDLVQIDTLDVRPIPGVVRKQFTGRDVIGKWDVIKVYGSATSSLAAKYLDTLISRMPFPVKAIQIDGGSEFKGEFESECQKREIALFILPPKSPKLNGCVERSHRTHTEEFYEVNDFSLNISILNQELLEWEKIYNTIRPHQALDYLTPLEYITQWKNKKGDVYGK
jgi:transposase InsO family protein